MSRFLDERGRIFGKVNIVDVAVLLVIIAVVAFVAVRATGGGSVTVPVRVTYTVEAVRQANVDAIQQAVQVKGVVRDDGGTLLGRVQEVVATPTQEEVTTPDGQLKAFPSPIFHDITVTVLGTGTLSGSTIRIGGVPLLIGHKVTLTGSDFEVQSTIMRVEQVK
jgi:Domain of unknown function (DUF4330)